MASGEEPDISYVGSPSAVEMESNDGERGNVLTEISEMIVEPKSECVLTRQCILVAKALIDPNSERIPLRVMNLTDAIVP